MKATIDTPIPTLTYIPLMYEKYARGSDPKNQLRRSLEYMRANAIGQKMVDRAKRINGPLFVPPEWSASLYDSLISTWRTFAMVCGVLSRG